MRGEETHITATEQLLAWVVRTQAERQESIVEIAKRQGYLYGVWVHVTAWARNYPAILDWTDGREGDLYWESFSDSHYIAFSSAEDMMLFKLTWIGV